ncbi:MAG: hypothetical protein ABI318_22135 [Chthoniobacteraceae bacterium]
MNRQKAIIGATLMLVVCAIAYWVWSNWGLITVDVNGKPLAEVIRSIEKQGGIVLKTNMDATKPVTMHVHKVPLTDALETLAGVTDSRWRLGYFFASDAGTLKSAFEMIASGKRPEGWKNFEVPLFGGRPGSLDDEAIPMDPRRDTWAVKAPEEKTLQAFLQAASAGVSASFTCPESFNPAISSTPSSGQIRKSASQLAKAAGAKMEEVFLLMGRPVGVVEADNRDDDDGMSGGSRGGGRGSFGGRSGGSGGPNFTLMRDRQLAEIAKLPASEQTSAKAEFDEREKLYTSLRDLSDDERRAKMNDYMNNPDNQQRMADRINKSNERKTPDQRLAKYQRYVAKKQAIISSRTK